MKKDNAYVVAVRRPIVDGDKEPNPWKYVTGGKYAETTLDEKAARRFDLGGAKQLTCSINGAVHNFTAAYFLASEFK